MNQDLCLSRKKKTQPKHGGHFGISAGGTRQGIRAIGWDFFLQRKMRTVHWGDVCVFLVSLYIYILCIYIDIMLYINKNSFGIYILLFLLLIAICFSLFMNI